MAKFKYQMQNILRIKEKMEDQAKLEFAVAQNAYDKEKEKLTFLMNRNQKYLDAGKELRAKKLQVRDIKENKEALLQMDLFIKEQEKALMEAEVRVEKKKAELILVMRERKTHEILKETAYNEYKIEEQAKESMGIDELVSYVYGKKGE
jgi:flagellar FliJ protein